MKLWSFTTVKNEEDIIESFVRYNMNILDGMIISDNYSTDNTLTILKQLKNEGYNIDIIEDKNKTFDQVKRKNELLNYTYKKYNPDFTFPLDADEFIFTNNKGNPRKIIEKLDTKTLYRYKMKYYVLSGKEKEGLFVPHRINNLRLIEESEDYNYKCIVPKKIDIDKVYLAMGAHTIFNESGKEIPSNMLNNLFIAHFPVRSKYQIMMKVILGRLNNARFNSRKDGNGFHQYAIIDEIIKEGTIEDKTLINISQYYSIKNHNLKIKTNIKPLNTDFCENIAIKYTKNSNDNKVLSNALITSFSIIDEMREEKNKLVEEKDYYRSSYYKIINSKGWKILESLRKFKKNKKE